MDEIEDMKMNLMLKYLKIQFPIKRLRDGRRFKRGVVIEPHHHYLSPKDKLMETFEALKKELKNVFGYNEYEANMAVLTYLNLL